MRKTPKSAYEMLDEAFYKFRTHTQVTEEFMALPHTCEWVKRFRELSGLSIRDMAILTGYKKSSVQKVELGYASQRYFRCVDNLWSVRLLDHAPEDLQAEEHAPEDGKISMSQIASSTGEWRRCPVCGEVKFFVSKRQAYCSDRCRYLARYRFKVRVKSYATQKRPKALICPSCGAYIPNYREFLVRNSTDTTFRQTPANEIRYLERKTGGSEIPHVLRRLESFVQAETHAQVQTSGSSPDHGGFYDRLLREIYDASQGKAGRL